MKPESLDALILDRALGELSPEAAEMLDEHLARDPECAARAARISLTVSAATSSLSDPQAVRSRDDSLPKPRWRAAVLQTAPDSAALQGRSSWWSRAQPLKIAASLAVGAALGWLGRPSPVVRVAATHPEVPVASQEDVRPAGQPPGVTAPDLWNQRTLAQLDAARLGVDRVPARYRLRWESPSRKPLLEEKQ